MHDLITDNSTLSDGPKDTSVSPLMEVDTGSNISLTCSSHANPPVEEYTWFKMYDDEIRTIGDEPELHLWEVSSDDDGQYFCSATNKHGSQNSSTETLKVNGKFVNMLILPALFVSFSDLIMINSGMITWFYSLRFIRYTCNSIQFC